MNVKGGIRTVFFDLDGTLSDPSEGIDESLSFALEKMGARNARIDDVRPFIGPPLQDTFSSLLGRALLKEGTHPGRVLMVGDREHDILGARSQGVDAAGVLWGFGTREELESAGPRFLIERPEDLPGVIRTFREEGDAS